MLATAAIVFLVSGCHKKTNYARNTPPPPPVRSNRDSNWKPAPVIIHDPSEDSNPGKYQPYTPYIDNGNVASTEEGLASWYGPPYHNRQAANGEIFDQNALTAAHRTLPLGTIVRVTNLSTGQSATVRITDRGPFVRGRVIDLSLAAAKATGIYRMGVAKVRIEVTSAQKPLTGGKWCVQIGVFHSEGNAQKLRSDLLHRYNTAKVIEFTGPTGHWVRIDPSISDKAHAQQVAAAIRPSEEDAQAFLVRLD